MRVASQLARALAAGLALGMATGCVPGTKEETPKDTGSQEIEFWTQTFVVPKGAKNPKFAAEFARYLTNAENQTAFCKLVTIYPSTSESLKDPFFSTFQPGKLSDEARKIVASELPKLKLGYLGTGKDDKLRERWLETVRAAYTGTKSVGQALADAEKEWNEILAAK